MEAFASERRETLFQAMREGFALCEAVRDDAGRLVDYWVREANPAFISRLGGPEVVGRRWRDSRPNAPDEWFNACGRVLRRGEPARFEFWDPEGERWYDVFLTPISKDELAQFYVDVTHRKRAETHQAELFKELNHRVKNNLTIVSAMLGLQARNAADPEVQRQLQQAVDRIQTISEVHSSLYSTGGVEHVSFDAYVAELCGRLSGSLLGEGVTIEVEATPAQVPIEQAVQLGIILNELVTNAAKHAYPPGSSGRIVVGFHSGPDGLELTVRDFGVGRAQTPTQSSTGLGMKLVRSLVQRTGGRLEIVSEHGVTAVVRLPLTSVADAAQANLF